jgi:hypothetical protein
MKDYRKSFFWSCLRRVRIYPFHVMGWRHKIGTFMHTITFWKFYNQEKVLKELSGYVQEYSPSRFEEELQRIEQSL